MTHTRPRRQARTVEEALERLDRWAGRRFDPELVALLLALARSGSLGAQHASRR